MRLTTVQMLREIVRRCTPWDSNTCAFCSATRWNGQSHDEDCVWRLVEEWLERQEEVTS